MAVSVQEWLASTQSIARSEGKDYETWLREPSEFYQGQTPLALLSQISGGQVTDPFNQQSAMLPDPKAGSLFDDLGAYAPVLAFAGPALLGGGFAGVGAEAGLGDAALGGFYGGLGEGTALGGTGALGMDDWLTQLLSESGELGVDAASLESGFSPATLAESFPSLGGGTSLLSNPLLSNLAKALGTSSGSGTGTSGSLFGDGWLSKLLGAAIPAGVGAFGASQQADMLKELSTQQRTAEEARYADLVKREEARYADLKSREDARLGQQRQDIEYSRNLGAPYRQRLSDLLGDPSSFLQSPGVQQSVQSGADALARALSSKVGNPAGNPSAMGDITNYATNQLYGQLGNELTRLGALGGLTSYGGAGATIPGINTGLPTTATAGSNIGTGGNLQAQMASIGQDTNMWNALGYGFDQFFNPYQKGAV